MEQELLNLGALALVFVLFIKEVFAYLKTRKSNNGHDDLGWLKKVFDELQLMNENHLHSIEKAIVDGNREIVKTISDGNRETASVLGRIEGGLRNK